MEPLPRFSLVRPETVAQALEMRQAHPGAPFIAGGTDLMVNIRRGIVVPDVLIDISGIAQMRRLETTDGSLFVGAAVTLSELAAHATVRESHAVLATAAGTVAGATHRHTATVGGNLCLDTRCVYFNQSEWWRRAIGYCLKHQGEICHVAPKGDRCYAAYSGDMAPSFLVLEAEAEIAGSEGVRTMPLQDLYSDDGARPLRLGGDELLVGVRVAVSGGLAADYAKARVRGALDFPLAGVAVALKRRGDDLGSLRVALTGTNPRPLLVAGTGDLAGAPLDEEALKGLERLVRKQVKPMRSTFSPGHHRRRVAAILARRLARKLFDEASRES